MQFNLSGQGYNEAPARKKIGLVLLWYLFTYEVGPGKVRYLPFVRLFIATELCVDAVHSIGSIGLLSLH